MSATKRIDGNYIIESLSGSATITLGESGGSDTVIIPGDLTVQGTTTSINTDDLFVKDKVITLNDGESGPGVAAPFFSGISVDRGDGVTAGEIFAQILWSEADNVWVVDLGDGNGPINEIITGAIGGGGFMQDLIDDLTPQVGGVVGLDMRVNAITTSDLGQDIAIELPVGNANNITLTVLHASSEIVLAGPAMIQGAAPGTGADSGEVALFQAADTGGGTKLHFENDTDTGELVSKTKAMVFGLIF